MEILMRLKTIIALVSALAAFSGTAVHAATNLVTNGDFEQTSNGNGQFNVNTTVADWNSVGYNFIFGPGTADSSGAVGTFGQLSLWGPQNGAANGLPASSPTGGNFVAADAGFGVGAVSQTINGLTAGQQYNLNFSWAAAQQSGFTGPTTENWTVSLGNQTQSTPVFQNTSHGFSGWMNQTFTFTATGASEILSFLASGGSPGSVPPFSLLDGVSLVAAVPEPSTYAMMLGGLTIVVFGARRRRNKSNKADFGGNATMAA
jgi:hypothetical protein